MLFVFMIFFHTQEIERHTHIVEVFFDEVTVRDVPQYDVSVVAGTEYDPGVRGAVF